MNISEFNYVLNQRISQIREVLSHKAKEYARDDRLHNFKVAADILGCSPAHALIGMKVKHDVSVLDLVRYPELRTPKLIDEKIGDSINYLILLEAILLEDGNDEYNTPSTESPNEI